MIDHDECTLCETCVDMCPLEIIRLGEDETGERIMIERDFCIGCGVCAVNCPTEAISLKKTSNHIPVESRPGLLANRPDAK